MFSLAVDCVVCAIVRNDVVHGKAIVNRMTTMLHVEFKLECHPFHAGHLGTVSI